MSHGMHAAGVVRPSRLPGLPFSLLHFERIESTSQYLRQHGRRQPQNCLVVTAEFQSGGRGRLGRRWEAPAGEALLFSMMLAPLEAHRALSLPLAAAVVMYDALRDLCPAVGSLDLKWPNDLMAGGRKLGGILVDADRSCRGVPFVVVGTGINCGQESFPPHLAQATSVRMETGVQVDRMRLLERFLRGWMDYCGPAQPGGGPWIPDPRAVVDDWKRRSTGWAGRRLRWLNAGAWTEAVVEDVVVPGALALRLADGRRMEVFSGDMEWL